MTAPTVEARILSLWQRLSGRPGGRWVFSRLLGRFVPYSGSIRPTVRVLEPGRAVVELRDRRRVRNHLGSVHAVALANLGELASGLAMTAALPPRTRAIVVGIDVGFHKKARGLLVAEGIASPPQSVSEPVEVVVRADVTDEAGESVATVTVRWRLAPRPDTAERDRKASE